MFGFAKKSYPYLLVDFLVSGTSNTQVLSRIKPEVSFIIFAAPKELFLEPCKDNKRFLNCPTSEGRNPFLTKKLIASFSDMPFADACIHNCMICWSENWLILALPIFTFPPLLFCALAEVKTTKISTNTAKNFPKNFII